MAVSGCRSIEFEGLGLRPWTASLRRLPAHLEPPSAAESRTLITVTLHPRARPRRPLGCRRPAPLSKYVVSAEILHSPRTGDAVRSGTLGEFSGEVMAGASDQLIDQVAEVVPEPAPHFPSKPWARRNVPTDSGLSPLSHGRVTR